MAHSRVSPETPMWQVRLMMTFAVFDFGVTPKHFPHDMLLNDHRSPRSALGAVPIYRLDWAVGEYDCPGSQCLASPLMMLVLAEPSAAAPPWAATDCLTRSAPDCAAAGCASAAPNTSATVGARIRNMISSLLCVIANVVGLRSPLSRRRQRY